MTNEERRNRLKELIKNAEQYIKKLSSKIDDLSKTKKAQKENKEEINELYKEIKEWEIILDTYDYIGYTLDIL